MNIVWNFAGLVLMVNCVGLIAAVLVNAGPGKDTLSMLVSATLVLPFCLAEGIAILWLMSMNTPAVGG